MGIVYHGRSSWLRATAQCAKGGESNEDVSRFCCFSRSGKSIPCPFILNKFANCDPITNSNFGFSLSGYISYQHCPENQLRPKNYVSGRRNDSREVRATTSVTYTNAIPSGNVMIDAFMFFQTQFRTTHATIHHDNPDRVYVGII